MCRNPIMKLVVTVAAILAVVYVSNSNPVQNEDEYSCVCPKYYEPVCASNQNTYNNKCLFECAQNYTMKKFNTALTIIKEKRCESV